MYGRELHWIDTGSWRMRDGSNDHHLADTYHVEAQLAQANESHGYRSHQSWFRGHRRQRHSNVLDLGSLQRVRLHMEQLLAMVGDIDRKRHWSCKSLTSSTLLFNRN